MNYIDRFDGIPWLGECGSPVRSKPEPEVGHIYREFIITTHYHIVLHHFNSS
jgi:hypothetical protein